MRVTMIRNASDGAKKTCSELDGDKINIKTPRVIDYVETEDQRIFEGRSTLYGTVHRVYECDGDVWFTAIGFGSAYMVELDKNEIVKYGNFKDSIKLSGGHLW